jgi:tRNA-modifying protein YgfZ
MSLIHLSSRGVVQVSGLDATTLLNGLLTNDVTRAGPQQAVFAAMLTPQGKYLFDMFVICPEPDTYWLDVSRPADFAKRLSMYRLRSQVTIKDVSEEFGVYADVEAGEANSFPDPRLPQLGHRLIALKQEAANEATYIAHCLNLGIPDPATDLLIEKDFIMEGLFDELHGLDHHKGCYVGQEMTSRMKRRTSVKNKLCRVRYDGRAPEFETPILADGWEVGRMRSGINGVGISMIRFDRARKAMGEGQALMAGEVAITLDPPEWSVEPEA